MSRLLIFGPGWVGTRLHESVANSVLSHVRIEDADAVRAELETYQPSSVVNCAGRTGMPNVDWCEDHPFETYEANVTAPLALARTCHERGEHLIHLGSGCVFYGESPDPAGWCEDDHANPSATYSRSKYAADLLLSMMPNLAIVRVRLPLDWKPDPKNSINKIAGYKKIIDVANSVTVLEDLFDVIQQLSDHQATGIFHAMNPGMMRHRDLIRLYRELVDPNQSNEWITEDELVALGLVAKKRSTNVCQNTRLPELGIHMRPIEVALLDTMERYAVTMRQN